MAYKAKDRTDLLSGIDEFLDQVTVLPPGEWDPTIRIEPPKNVPSQVSESHYQTLCPFTWFTTEVLQTVNERFYILNLCSVLPHDDPPI